MCSIIGVNGQDAKRDIFSMLSVLEHRGPDGMGVYSNNTVLYDEKTRFIQDSNFMLAHNLLSIIGSNESQPILEDEYVIVANAEIYNYKELIKEHNLTDFKTNSDCEVILKLVKKYFTTNLLQTIRKILPLLDGDYAFCISDGKDYVVIRDEIGVKPIYYGNKGDTFAFASEMKALKENNYGNIESLNPIEAIINDEIIKIREESKRKPENIPYNLLKEELQNNMECAVKKRVKGLNKVALLFSGGVDSTLLAVLLKNYGVNVTLYTVGTKNSQDLQFAQKVAQDIQLPLKTWIIDEKIVENNFIKVINIIEDTNLMKVGVAMTIYLTSKLAKNDNHKVILSGQGADELFCGYNRYKNKYENQKELLEELTNDINKMYEVNLERDDKATMSNSIELRVPFLDKKVVNTAIKTPINYMLDSNEDNIRKHILRDIARDVGVPEYIAYRPKKAAQYGTGIDKIIKKKIIKKDEFKKYSNRRQDYK